MLTRPRASESESARQTLATTIAVDLRRAIMRGELLPGTKLHIEELRERFDVSLSPLREALSRLGSAGLVDIEDQRGYRVATVSEGNLTEVVRLRMEFESLALRESFALADNDWRERVESAMAEMAGCARVAGHDKSNEQWESSHRRFHLTLLSGCRMPILLAFITNLHDLSDRYRRLFLMNNPPDRDVPREHRRIYEAVIAQEPDIACALLRQHIQRTGFNVREALVRSVARAEEGL